ncbi:MAG: hypothetical protein U0169_01615 [Polyangiaceae bacterium]
MKLPQNVLLLLAVGLAAPSVLTACGGAADGPESSEPTAERADDVKSAPKEATSALHVPPAQENPAWEDPCPACGTGGGDEDAGPAVDPGPAPAEDGGSDAPVILPDDAGSPDAAPDAAIDAGPGPIPPEDCPACGMG